MTTLKREQLAEMYRKGYRYYVSFEKITPLCFKSVMDVGPFLRKNPTERVINSGRITKDGFVTGGLQ